jgi:RNA polymerase sigma factor (sigma-70 family)
MQRSAFIFWRASFIIKLTMAQPHAFIASQRRVSLYNLPDWCAKPDDDLLIAFRAEVALPQKLQPIRNCATFELAYRALALRANSLFEAFDGQYRRLLVKWLHQTSQAALVLSRLDSNMDDLVTSVYMCLFRTWHGMDRLTFYQKFDGRPAKVFAYLHSTCSSVVTSMARKRDHNSLPLDEEIANMTYQPDEWLNDSIDVQQRIKQLLTDEERAVYDLYMQGYPVHEIAARLRITDSQVRLRLRSLFQKLRNDADLRALLQGSSD